MIFDETTGSFIPGAIRSGRSASGASPSVRRERREDAAAALLGVRVSLLSIHNINRSFERVTAVNHVNLLARVAENRPCCRAGALRSLSPFNNIHTKP